MLKKKDITIVDNWELSEVTFFTLNYFFQKQPLEAFYKTDFLKNFTKFTLHQKETPVHAF